MEVTGVDRAGECLPTHLAPTGTQRHLLWGFRETAGRIWGWVRTEHLPSRVCPPHQGTGEAGAAVGVWPWESLA